ncbi:BtrH N-terminal domain-containing protein [Paenibacillus sp. P25]|nr:BtrH N-terminal domain-containing protein [Paenibacillus sp. P25]
MPGASSDVPVRAGSHCLFASLRRMLADKYGLIMTEAEIYFRCDAMNVEHHPRSRPLWIGRSGQEMMRHFADTGPAEMDYEFATEEGLANSKLLGRIQPPLASGEPVLLFVHSGSLTYHPIYRENPSRAHVICGYGWDERSGAIHVIDSFLLDYTGTAHSYQGPASYKELSLGVYGVAWMKEIYPHAVQPENGAYVSESGKERQAAFITLMKRRMMEYLQGSSRNDGTVRGLAAYDSLYRSLETVVDWDSAAFTDGCKELYYVLRIGKHHAPMVVFRGNRQGARLGFLSRVGVLDGKAAGREPLVEKASASFVQNRASRS